MVDYSCGVEELPDSEPVNEGLGGVGDRYPKRLLPVEIRSPRPIFMIETLDDIIEDLANKLGIYGAHGRQCEDGSAPRICRGCWTYNLKSRIRNAVEVETILARYR
jgi:hypothetical protein